MKILAIAMSRIPAPNANGIQVMKVCQAFAQLGHEGKIMSASGITFTGLEYLAFLLLVIVLSIVAIIIWLRTSVFPRATEKTTYVPELPLPVEDTTAKPLSKKLELGLALGAIIIYLSTRLIAIDEFPIYFFSDEAAQTVLAETLVENNFKIEDEFLPTYFYNSDKYSLSISVYLQILPYLILGKSIWVTRSVSVLITLIGVLSIGLILNQFFEIKNWWLSILLLSITPVWFLHSRTAFETVIATAFYAGFLYTYFLYLYKSPKYLFLTLFAAALTFYTYNPARMVILVTCTLLLFFDFRFHWQNRKLFRLGIIFILFLAYPYIRFVYYHPNATSSHLLLLNSYWTQDIQITQKLLLFGREYLKGLSIQYWFFPKTQDIIRHVMKGYGNFLLVFLPFFLVGLWAAIKKWRNPAYRILLTALISAPTGGALVEHFVTRALIIVVPVTIFSTIGVVKFLNKLSVFQKQREKNIILLFLVLCLGNIAMLSDVLSHSALWFDNYGLYGMQYGGKEVFSIANDYLVEDKKNEVIMSYMWFNGPDIVMRFFVDDLERVRWMIPEDMKDPSFSINKYEILILSHDEWDIFLDADVEKFSIMKIIPYPDNTPGFYFLESK